MLPENTAIETITQATNNLSLDEAKQNYKINLEAYSYIPEYTDTNQNIENPLDNFIEKDTLISTITPKMTKKNEEIEINRNKTVSQARESKETVNIVFIGHVDAGKSTIGGHILFLTGMVDKRTLEKYEKEAREKNRESWYFSWALDTNTEERDKGKTVEVGKAYFETHHKRFILLDAPGHKAYVPNMIGGAAQADVAVLVISARKGEFETGFDKGGQTREHAQIARISGIKHLIVVINKMDDPTVKWSETRFNDIWDRLAVYLKKVGWKSSEMYCMPISGFSGANLKEPISGDICSWWVNKPSFLQYLDSLPTINQDIEGAPMVIISDKYKDMGPVCMGKVISGCFMKNDSFVVMPIQKTFKISNILSLDDEEKQMAKIGENIKLRLIGADEQDLLGGYVLCDSLNLCPVGRIFDAQLIIIECKSIISAGYKAIIHVHNVVDEVTLVAIKKLMDRKTQQWQITAPRFVRQDNICVVRLSMNNVQCIAPISKIPYLGRFSIRDEGKTVAFGKILKVIS
ncbi:hypothetical protein HZS_4286 [Henneguya salminicola]|nr:hypothetical protein HZS_4286 [Henneguya salminicola]